MEVLFLAPRLPWPLDTGAKIRTFHLLKALGRAHNVTCLSFVESTDDLANADAIRPYVKRLELVHRRHDLVARLIDGALGAVGPLPYSMRKYERHAMGRAVREIIRENRPDIVHCDHLHLAPYGMISSSIPFAIDDHNVESLIWRRYAKSETGIRKIAFAEQAVLWTRAEARAAEQAWTCLVTSEADRKELLRISKANVHVVPNGVDLEHFGDLTVAPSSSGHLVLTGSMDWQPNEDAAIWFANEILPQIHRTDPGVQFDVVGRNPSERVRNLATTHVNVTGTVPDVRPYLRAATALVVPIRVGGGTRLKILEAFAAQVPVISTRVGAEGIGCTHEREILFADTPQEFAQAVERLKRSPELRATMVEQGRKLVEARFGWDAIGRDLAELYGRAPSYFQSHTSRSTRA